MDWIGIVGGHPHDVAHLAAAASALGLRTAWATSARGGVAGVRRVAGAPSDHVAVLAGLRDLGRAAVVGVLAGDRRRRAASWALSEALGLPRLRSPGAAALAESRIAVLTRLAEAGLRVPSWRVLREASDVPDGHGWEWAIKADRPGPSPVILPTRRMQAAAAFAAARVHAEGGAVYAQRWIAASAHLHVQAVMLGGRVTALGILSRQFLGSAPYQITSGFDLADISGAEHERISAIVTDIARACRWLWGPIVVDLVSAGGEYLVIDATPGVVEIGALALLDLPDDSKPYAQTVVRSVIGAGGAVIMPHDQEAALRYVVAVEGDEGRLIERYETRPRRLPIGAYRWVRPGDRIREPRTRREAWGIGVAVGHTGTGLSAGEHADVLAAECYSSVVLEGDTDVDAD